MTRKILREILVKKCGLDPNFIIYCCDKNAACIKIKQSSYFDIKSKLTSNGFRVIPFDKTKYKLQDIYYIKFRIPQKYKTNEKSNLDLEDDLIRKSIIEYNEKEHHKKSE